MKTLPARLLANIIFGLSLTLLIAVGSWYLASHDAPDDHDAPAPPPVHLTQAQWQVTEAADWNTPAPSLDSRDLPHAWHPIAVPASFPRMDHLRASAAGSIQTTWIRFAVDGQQALPASLVLYGIRMRTEGNIAVYANGQLIHRAQQHGPLWNSLFSPLWVALDARDVRDNSTPVHEILIRLEHPPNTRTGVSSLWLGTAESLRGRYYTRQWLQRELPATLSAAFLVVGIFALLVWLRRPDELAYLLFFNIAVISFVGHLHYYVSLPIIYDWFAWLTANALFWLIAILHLFLGQLHRRAQPWLTGTVLTLVLGISVLTLLKILPYYPNPSILIQVIYGIAIVLAAVVSTAGIINSRHTSKEGLLVAACAAISTLLGMSDWLLYSGFIDPEGWFLGAYTNAVTFALFGTLMYRRYVGAIVEVEDANANLARRLQARETELESSHRQLREAALRQTISDERQRLMQDMHDGLGSSLISAIRSLEKGSVSDTKVSQILRDCLDDLKLTIDSMEPVDADLVLLLATLRFRLAPRLEDAGIVLSWQVRQLPTLAWLDPSSALNILRIIQESIANVLRHTRATEIRVLTTQDAHGVTVTIEDNGPGFNVEQALARAGGRGLQNQRRRAHAIDGRVSWEAGAQGTRFALWLPLRR